MLTLSTVLGVGFLLGLRHATDPDHVIAMSTIVTRERKLRAALLLGALWGVGHTLTLAVIGTLMIGFGVIIPLAVGQALEAVVGAMLVVLGVWALLGVYRAVRQFPQVATHLTEHRAQVGTGNDCAYVRARRFAAAPARRYRHRHPHAHGDYVHSHAHGHGIAAHGHPAERTTAHWLDRRLGGWAWYQWLRPVTIGVVHGLAGSAPIALLIMASTRDAATALCYFLAFGFGTMLGMATLTGAIAAPLVLAARRLPRLGDGVRLLAGIVSVAFGLFLMLQFSAHASGDQRTAHGTLRDFATAHGTLRESNGTHGTLRDSITVHGDVQTDKEPTQ